MRDEIVARGIRTRAVLVNPNGVDPDRYRPDVDGGPVRARYGLRGFTVVGLHRDVRAVARRRGRWRARSSRFVRTIRRAPAPFVS